jgi:hypothetical protein
MIDLDTKDWIQICHVVENEICFTQEYLNIIKCLGWGARKFAAHLITHWEPKYQNVLDYFGPEEAEEDWYSGIDGEPMDVSELIADLWEVHGLPIEGLDGEWHRDMMRAKLISLKLPRKLIEQYVEIVQKQSKKGTYDG